MGCSRCHLVIAHYAIGNKKSLYLVLQAVVDPRKKKSWIGIQWRLKLR